MNYCIYLAVKGQALSLYFRDEDNTAGHLRELLVVHCIISYISHHCL